MAARGRVVGHGCELVRRRAARDGDGGGGEENTDVGGALIFLVLFFACSLVLCSRLVFFRVRDAQFLEPSFLFS